MISPEYFCRQLAELGIDFYVGVPDSLLKSLCAYIDKELPAGKHIISANEGNAVAIAAGHYLGCGKPAVVYMQNSGLGNTVNPLTSLADPKVYSIPMLLVIGWRGEPGVKDEPQHIKQGEITPSQLDILGVPYQVVDAASDLNSVLPDLLTKMNAEKRPVALLVRKDTFENYKADKPVNSYVMSREQAIAEVLDLAQPKDLVISTTGKASREVFEFRQANKMRNNDFLTVGAMGHTASIALGVAKAQPDRKVIVLDGDGSLLMHMGSMAIIAQQKLPNLIHIVLNNACHESVGGQKTVADQVNIVEIAKACGYTNAMSVTQQPELKAVWPKLQVGGTHLIEIKINSASRNDLGRPTNTPIENKVAFMQHAVDSRG